MNSPDDVVIEFRPRRLCFHTQLIVDNELEKIECKQCGEKLNPYFAIRKLMTLSDRWKRERIELDLAREAAEKKLKTKCDHCQKITRVRTDVKNYQIIQRINEETT